MFFKAMKRKYLIFKRWLQKLLVSKVVVAMFIGVVINFVLLGWRSFEPLSQLFISFPKESVSTAYQPHVQGEHAVECSGDEPGPFLAFSYPTNGVSNQYQYLHDAIILAFGFEGTVVLPRYASSRNPLKVKELEHTWKEVPIETLFDIAFTTTRLRNIGMNVCVESKNLNRRINSTKWVNCNFHYWRLVRKCRNKIGCFASYINYMIRTRFSPNHFLILPNIWGAVPISHSIKAVTPMLQLSARVTLSLKFASKLEKLGTTLFNTILEKAKEANCQTVNVLHLRIESDYKAHMTVAYPGKKNYTTANLIEPYDIFFRNQNMTGFFYVAVGFLTSTEYQLATNWLRTTFGSKWIFKDSHYSMLIELEAEERAVVDYYVMLKAHQFIGNGASSLSYIVSEMRNYLGLKSWLVRPLSEIYYPLLGLRNNIWSNEPFAKLRPSKFRP